MKENPVINYTKRPSFNTEDHKCKCKNCGTIYIITYRGWWQNHFYCGDGCAREYNACTGCGYNKHHSRDLNDAIKILENKKIC